MALSTAGNGPILSPEQVAGILTVPLQKASIFLSLGVRIIESHGPVRVPLLTGSDEPSWHGENEKIDEVEVDFGEVLLLSPNIKSIKSLNRYSNELARQSVADAITAVQQRMVADVAGKIDTTFFTGDGAVVSGQRTEPLGLLNYTGVQEMTAVGAPTIDDLHDAEGLALGAEVDPAALVWVMNSRDFVNLRKLKDNGGRYLIQPDVTESGRYQLLGHRVFVTNRLPADLGTGTNESNIVLMDPSKIAVARDLAPSLTVLPELFGDYDQGAIRVVCRYDAAPLNPEAVVILRGVTAPGA
ncbi:capsid protein [Rhodococcus sp. 2G]|uniref:phage major capsid protein n=1 Tax=Rhodococcus sp. 2G TaxID=1570939 RepID=UPI0009038A6C|nr:phage major capsid protein [Rhodococcus sp. 2G]APE08617.1 capsid protein [Rhodococcus sp. 2G]